MIKLINGTSLTPVRLLCPQFIKLLHNPVFRITLLTPWRGLLSVVSLHCWWKYNLWNGNACKFAERKRANEATARLYDSTVGWGMVGGSPQLWPANQASFRELAFVVKFPQQCRNKLTARSQLLPEASSICRAIISRKLPKLVFTELYSTGQCQPWPLSPERPGSSCVGGLWRALFRFRFSSHFFLGYFGIASFAYK